MAFVHMVFLSGRKAATRSRGSQRFLMKHFCYYDNNNLPPLYENDNDDTSLTNMFLFFSFSVKTGEQVDVNLWVKEKKKRWRISTGPSLHHMEVSWRIFSAAFKAEAPH